MTDQDGVARIASTSFASLAAIPTLRSKGPEEKSLIDGVRALLRCQRDNKRRGENPGTLRDGSRDNLAPSPVLSLILNHAVGKMMGFLMEKGKSERLWQT